MISKRNSKPSSSKPDRTLNRGVSAMLGDAHPMWERPVVNPGRTEAPRPKSIKPLVGRDSEGWLPPVGSASDLPAGLASLLKGAGGAAIEGSTTEQRVRPNRTE